MLEIAIKAISSIVLREKVHIYIYIYDITYIVIVAILIVRKYYGRAFILLLAR